MPQFFISLEISSAAFADGNEKAETIRILYDIANRVNAMEFVSERRLPGAIWDSNGSRVGCFGWETF